MYNTTKSIKLKISSHNAYLHHIQYFSHLLVPPPSTVERSCLTAPCNRHKWTLRDSSLIRMLSPVSFGIQHFIVVITIDTKDVVLAENIIFTIPHLTVWPILALIFVNVKH